MSRSIGALLIIMGVVLAACAPAPARQSGSNDAPAAQRGAPKSITVAIMADPPIVAKVLNPGSHFRGVEHLEALLDAGVTRDGGGSRRPEMAEAVPSTENGLWKLNPDGTMEITWKLKEGLQWHDGTPFTSADLMFTMQVGMDKDVPLFSADPLFGHVASYEAPDPRTMVVRWKDPYIDAERLFGLGDTDISTPIAKHLMEQHYLANKTIFGDNPYFGPQHVGTGPFKLKSWEAGSHLTMSANDNYVLGRPKIDEIVVKFIEDARTLQANLMAGSVDMTLGRNLSGPQTLEVKTLWPDGQMFVDYSSASIIDAFIQQLNPDPQVMTNVSFRKAGLLSLDRQSMVDALVPMQSEVAHSFIAPNQPAYQPIWDKYTLKYPYDPRQATQMLQGIGYTLGPDGLMHDAFGEPLAWQIRTTAGDDLREKMILTAAADWKKVGANVSPYVIPRQQADDPEYRAGFTGMEVVRQPSDVRGIKSLHSRTTSLPENQFRGTGNRSRYFNADLDDLIDRVYTTIPLDQRRDLMGQIDRILTTNVPFYMILYSTGTYLVNNRVTNFQSDGPWNAYQWDTKP